MTKMSKSLTVFLILLWVSVASAANSPQWIVGAVVTNPTTNQVLVSTQPSAGQWSVSAYVYSNVGTATLLQRVNINSIVVQSIVIPASVSFILFQAPYPLLVSTGDTLRVVSRGNVIGEAQATLFLVLQ